MFSFALYKEGLRRCFIPAIILNAVMLLFAMIIPISVISNASRWHNSPHPRIVSGLAANPFLLVALLLALFLTLHTFSYLRERNASDFYHSIPHKRESLFLSYAAAIFSWVIASIIASTMVASAIYAMGLDVIRFEIGSVILAALSVMAACFMIIAATLIAMSVTGTIVSNVTTTALILGLPQILIGVFIANTLTMTRGLIFANGILPFGHMGWVASLIENGPSLSAIIYVTILALLHLAAAYWLFKKRKSETAEVSAGNSFIQSTIRCAIAIAITIPVLLLIITSFRNSGSEFVIISIYSIAIIAYFAYEAITGRRLRKTRTQTFAGLMAGLAIVLAFNVIFVIGVNVNREIILSQYRNADRINAVQVDLNWRQRWHWHTNYRNGYTQLSSESFTITDNEVIELLIEANNRNISNIRNHGWRHGRNDSYGFESTSVTFNPRSPRTSTRNLILTRTEMRTLIESLSVNEDFIAAHLILPRIPQHIEVWVMLNDWEGMSLTDHQARQVYGLLKEELTEIDPVAWFIAINLEIYQGSVDFTISGWTDYGSYWQRLPVNSTLTPRTYALIRQLAR